MIANSEGRERPAVRAGARRRIPRGAARLLAMLGIAATLGAILTAAGAPVRLVGVTARGDAVIIESTEPAAYSVSRPDSTTLVIEMRNVSVGDARSEVSAQGAIAGVRLEQAADIDGRSLARVHLALTRPSEHTVRSARNTIRVELVPRGGAAPVARTAVAVPAPVPAAAPAPKAVSPSASARQPVVAQSVEKKPAGVATILERIQSRNTPSATTITLSGNGHLAPGTMTESKDRPRRLVFDFPDVSSKAPTQTTIDSPLVSTVMSR
jgi:hypothetical protein